MATRSLIGLERDNNIVEYIYCHWGGHPNDNGKLLMTKYNSIEDFETLLKMGAISTLGNTIDETTFFCRDLDELFSDVKSAFIDKDVFLSDSEKGIKICGSEYRYLYTKDNALICYSICEESFISIPSDNAYKFQIEYSTEGTISIIDDLINNKTAIVKTDEIKDVIEKLKNLLNV